MKKIPKKYAQLLFTIYTSALMSLIISAVLIAINTGIDTTYPHRLLRAWATAWPIAFTSLALIRPLISRLVQWSTA